MTKVYRTFVWGHALYYLQERADMQVVHRHMIPFGGPAPESLGRVYQRLLESLINRRNMPQTIGDIRELEGTLFDFNVNLVLTNYQADWKQLFEAVRAIRPDAKMDAKNSRSYWTIFCKGAISAAKYLRQFDSLDDFRSFVMNFDSRLTTRPALPLLLAAEIYGLGFALACDFLKELGFTNYSKPDVHLLRIFPALGIAEPSELAVFRAVSVMASEVGETPYAVDKAFWLIGSGNLYLVSAKIETDEQEFIQWVLEQWRVANPTARLTIPVS